MLLGMRGLAASAEVALLCSTSGYFRFFDSCRQTIANPQRQNITENKCVLENNAIPTSIAKAIAPARLMGISQSNAQPDSANTTIRE